MLERSVETLRLMAGAETAKLHLTLGDKAGRYEIAQVQEYQAKRGAARAEGLVERVSELREFMAHLHTPTLSPHAWYDREADDGLCQVMWEARDADPELIVMWSLDKDLYMVGGYHLAGEDYKLEMFPWGYGECQLVKTGTQKKVVGQGTSFFWHQLLMGDGADNIPGLPKVSRDTVLSRLPHPKYLSTAYNRKAKTNAQRIAKQKAIMQAEGKIKSKTCGAVTAYELLRKCRTDKQALAVVQSCYLDWYGARHDFESWRGEDLEVTSGDMLVEQARLLWMQRTPGQDALEFLKEVINGTS
jgi:hypothetical protein